MKIAVDSPYMHWISNGLDLIATGLAQPKEALRFLSILLDPTRVHLEPAAQKQVTRTLNHWAQGVIKSAGSSFATLRPCGRILLQSPRFSSHLSQKTRGELEAAFVQLGATRHGQAHDEKVNKVLDNTEATWTKIQLETMITQRWTPQLQAHVQRTHERDLAISSRRVIARTNALDPSPLIANQGAQQAVQAILHLAKKQPMHHFLAYLEARLSALHTGGDPGEALGLAAAMASLRAQAEQRMLRVRPETAQMLLAGQLSRKILTHASRVSASTVLPQTLPPPAPRSSSRDR